MACTRMSERTLCSGPGSGGRGLILEPCTLDWSETTCLGACFLGTDMVMVPRVRVIYSLSQGFSGFQLHVVNTADFNHRMSGVGGTPSHLVIFLVNISFSIY